MGRQMFVNLPVADLDRAVGFFGTLGFAFNPQFTDENATCMLVGDDSFVMLLVRPYFQGFTERPLPDTRAATGVLLALGLGSREDVDRMVDAAVAAGGREARPVQDHGFMYVRTFEDLDGHWWEPFHMSAMPPG